MLDHMILTVSNIERSLAFYEAALKPLNIKFSCPTMAESNGKVDEFYRAAIFAGARDNISPQARVEYYPEYYAAGVSDPDGYSFEVVHKNKS
jgi:hypothetical protein